MNLIEMTLDEFKKAERLPPLFVIYVDDVELVKQNTYMVNLVKSKVEELIAGGYEVRHIYDISAQDPFGKRRIYFKRHIKEESNFLSDLIRKAHPGLLVPPGLFLPGRS